MRTSERGMNLIKKYEGLHDGDLKAIGLQPKMCPANVWTEGWDCKRVDNVSETVLTRDYLRDSLSKVHQ